MVPRMEGKGNMGKLMTEMMAGVEAPAPEDEQAIVAYHRKHAQRAARSEEDTRGQRARRRALPRRLRPVPRAARPAPPHAPKEWPAVVARMQKNMEWMNRVVGSKPVPGEPQLRIEDINAFLIRHARR